MIFYTAIDDEGRTHLVGTQADARAVNRHFEQIDIPTDKAGLMGFVQNLYTEIDRLNELALNGVNMGIATGLDMAGGEEAPDAVSVPVQAPAPRPLQPTGIDADGHPKVRPAFTSSQLEAMFSRRSEHVQDICYAISKLEGRDLGYVAFEVAARLTQNIVMPLNNEEPVDG